MVSQGQYYNPLPALYLFPRGDNFDEIRLYERYDTNYGFMKQYCLMATADCLCRILTGLKTASDVPLTKNAIC